MAELIRDGDTLTLKLTTLEKMEGVHGDLRAPIGSVTAVTVLDDTIHEVRGWKLPGTRLPGVFAVGTFVSGEERVFAIVHHRPASGVKVSFRTGTHSAWIVSAEDPKALIAALNV